METNGMKLCTILPKSALAAYAFGYLQIFLTPLLTNLLLSLLSDKVAANSLSVKEFGHLLLLFYSLLRICVRLNVRFQDASCS